ncbi:MAG: DNA alkylation repair protein [Gammaproteobacteria bacterium]|nr:DNA alkylation repair protein [Gammaproteobacteria bacterium]
MTDPHTRQAIARLRALERRNTPNMREIRRWLSKALADEPPRVVRKVAQNLIDGGYRWFGYEVVNNHSKTLRSLKLKDVEGFGAGIASWSDVDTFAGYIAGPAWTNGQISDAAVRRWTRSQDRWWRRTSLVATTTWNLKSKGGVGDAKRTLDIAGRLVADHDDMVVKALSWALRTLVAWDAEAVRGFLHQHTDDLAARVKREVRNKLETGLKNR